MGCDSCNVLYINRLKTHEIGCPDAWSDYKRECAWCGAEFEPEFKGQKCCCVECWDSYN